MLKLTFCLRRKPGLTLAAFQDYWLNKHGPLVHRLQPALGMVRYVQLHRRDDELGSGMAKVRGAPEPYDGVAELWWEDREGFSADMKSEAAARGTEDLKNFTSAFGLLFVEQAIVK